MVCVGAFVIVRVTFLLFNVIVCLDVDRLRVCMDCFFLWFVLCLCVLAFCLIRVVCIRCD